MSEGFRADHIGVEAENRAPEGAATGATIGGVLGEIVAGLATTGAVVGSGGSVLVAGPVAAALAGAGAGGATGVLLGALMGAGVPKHEVNAFESALNKKKGMVLGVSIENGDERREDIKRIMKDNVGKGVLVQQPLGVSEIAGRKFA